MNFLLSTDLQEFAVSLESFLAERYPIESLAHRESDYNSLVSAADCKSSSIWKALVDLGVFSASIEETHGGLGLGISALNVIGQSLGANPIPCPLNETLIFGADLLSQLGSETQKAKLHAQISTGSLVSTAAVEQLYSQSTTKLNLNINSDATAAEISGELSFIPYLETADLLLIPLKSPAVLLGIKLPLTTGATLQRLDTIDLLRPYYKLTLDKAKAEILSDKITDDQICTAILRLSALAAAEMVGASAQALKMSVEYAKVRKQFGRAIGSFQAVSQKLAQMQVKVSAAEALVRFALWSSENDHSSFQAAALAAKSFANIQLLEVCEAAIQAHGGIGFTYEYSLHFYLRRVRALATLFGNSSDFTTQLAELRVNS